MSSDLRRLIGKSTVWKVQIQYLFKAPIVRRITNQAHQWYNLFICKHCLLILNPKPFSVKQKEREKKKQLKNIMS